MNYETQILIVLKWLMRFEQFSFFSFGITGFYLFRLKYASKDRFTSRVRSFLGLSYYKMSGFLSIDIIYFHIVLKNPMEKALSTLTHPSVQGCI